jgi:hypothetical protein
MLNIEYHRGNNASLSYTVACEGFTIELKSFLYHIQIPYYLLNELLCIFWSHSIFFVVFSSYCFYGCFFLKKVDYCSAAYRSTIYLVQYNYCTYKTTSTQGASPKQWQFLWGYLQLVEAHKNISPVSVKRQQNRAKCLGG